MARSKGDYKIDCEYYNGESFDFTRHPFCTKLENIVDRINTSLEELFREHNGDYPLLCSMQSTNLKFMTNLYDLRMRCNLARIDTEKCLERHEHLSEAVKLETYVQRIQLLQLVYTRFGDEWMACLERHKQMDRVMTAWYEQYYLRRTSTKN